MWKLQLGSIHSDLILKQERIMPSCLMKIRRKSHQVRTFSYDILLQIQNVFDENRIFRLWLIRLLLLLLSLFSRLLLVHTHLSSGELRITTNNNIHLDNHHHSHQNQITVLLEEGKLRSNDNSLCSIYGHRF